MADLNLRLGRDVLTVADNLSLILIDRGFDEESLQPMVLEVEPENYEDALRSDASSGAQCIVINFFNYTPSNLRAFGVLDRAEQLGCTNIKLTQKFKIQHPLIKITPSGLPLDSTSKTSLKENCEQYKFVGKLFDELKIDGFLLSDFDDESEIKCALTGIRMVSDKPIICDMSQIAEHDLIEADYGDCVYVPQIIDCNKFNSTDELLDFALSLAESKNQFLILKNATSAKVAAVAATTSGIQLN